MIRKVTKGEMETLRCFQSLYLRTKYLGVKLNNPKLTLRELLEFWTDEIKNLKTTKQIEEYCMPVAQMEYKNVLIAAKKYL